MKMYRRSLHWVFVYVLASTLVGMGASAQTLVVPSALQAVEGNTNNCFPFDVGTYNFQSMRYQQVYAASEFAAGGPVLITRIAFRPDGEYAGALDAVLPAIQINFSTTKAGPDSLNTTFSANVGADDTVVYSGPLHLVSLFSGAVGGPLDFDIQIPLATPFLYDPSAGNLLVDVRNVAGGTLYVPFDAQMQSGDSTSCVFSYGPDTVQDTEGFTGGNFSFGLVTQFTFETMGAGPTLVAVDIKPQDCPNIWNIKSEGVLSAAILGLQNFDVSTVDPASIRLAGVAPLRSAIEDVATPCEPYVGKTSSNCTPQAQDGHNDLTLKFDSSELYKSIQASLGHEPYDGEVLVLVLTASLKATAAALRSKERMS
jgi:hypothetical protein